MRTKMLLPVCLLPAFLPFAVRADDPVRYVRDSTLLICDPAIEAEAVARFNKWVVVRDVEMQGTPIVLVGLSEDGLNEDALLLLTKLRQLRCFKGEFLNGKQVRSLAQIRQLEELVLLSTNTDADDLKALASLQRLRSLTLHKNTVTDDGLKELLAFPRLQELHLYRCVAVTAAGVKQLVGCKQLRSISLVNMKLSDADLEALGELQQLESLNLAFSTKVTGAGLKVLIHCPRLRKLDLGGCSQLTDADFHDLASLNRLRELDVRGYLESPFFPKIPKAEGVTTDPNAGWTESCESLIVRT